MLENNPMEKSKLLTIVRSMHPEERDAFSEFVASPYFNKKEALGRMYTYLLAQAPAFKAPAVTKEKVYGAIFPDQPFDEKHFGYLMSYLTQLLYQFFKIHSFEKQSPYQDYYLLSSLLDKKLFKAYEQAFKKAKIQLDKQAIKDANYYLKQHLLSKAADEYGRKRNLRVPDEHLQESTNYLDYFYIYNKIINSCNLKDRQKFLIADYEYNLLAEVNLFVKNHVVKNEPGIAIYSKILDMLGDDKTEEHFRALKELIDLHFSTVSKAEMRDAYLYAINYCARKIRSGDSNYMAEALDLYVDGIDREILYENGLLSPWTFANVVKVALRLKRYQWTETFIEINHSKLPADMQQNVLNYNLAELYYETQEFDKAITRLNNVKYTDSTYALGSRVLLAKVYYELQEEEALLSLIASFSIFLKRNKKISSKVKRPYLNFCDLLYGLMKRKVRKLPGLKERIEGTESLTERAWLLKVWHQVAGVVK